MINFRLLLSLALSTSLVGCNKVLKTMQCGGLPETLTFTRPLIVIMAGQSNMAGGYNEDRVVPDTPQIRYVSAAGSGPIEPFAEDFVAAHPTAQLIIVSCPAGGTYISQWAPGGLIEKCIKAAKTEAPNGVISGFIFLQGEADAKYGEEYAQTTYEWAQAFIVIARYVRQSLGVNVPIVLCRISHTTLPGFPAWPHVRDEQDSVNMDNLIHVSTDGVGLVDGIHYDQPGYQLVGSRMATALYNLLLDPN